jgi:hypothetical protein
MNARLAAVVERLRDSFMFSEIAELGCIPGYAQMADCLTMRNPTGWRSLIEASGIATIDMPDYGDFRGNSWRHTVSGDDA